MYQDVFKQAIYPSYSGLQQYIAKKRVRWIDTDSNVSLRSIYGRRLEKVRRIVRKLTLVAIPAALLATFPNSSSSARHCLACLQGSALRTQIQTVYAAEQASVGIAPSAESWEKGKTVEVKITGESRQDAINIAKLLVAFPKSSLTMQSCQAQEGYKGIAGKSPCTVNESGLQIQQEAQNAEGTRGTVSLTIVRFQANRDGEGKFTLLEGSELVVKDADGQSKLIRLQENDASGKDQGQSQKKIPFLFRPFFSLFKFLISLL